MMGIWKLTNHSVYCYIIALIFLDGQELVSLLPGAAQESVEPVGTTTNNQKPKWIFGS
jgi:hypothetical protein